MMKRHAEIYLQEWKDRKNRKPLILRGARQVGKTYLIRAFGKAFDHVVELNFERVLEAEKIFEADLNPKRIIQHLSILLKDTITPGKTLLFFDEVQVAPKAILALRYFYEEMPDLHVVAAGSLIDFALEQQGVPVGRVSFLYLYPMSFLEFLGVTESPLLLETLLDYRYSQGEEAFPYHEKLLQKVAEYMAVGGMPEAVQTWIETQDIYACQRVHFNIIEAYRQDFGKYAKQYQIRYMDRVFDNIPRLLGNKIKYTALGKDAKARELAPCLDLLVKAGVIHQVFQSSSQEPSLGAGINQKQFKAIFLDVGLSQAVLGLDLGNWVLNPKQSLQNKGPIVEAFVGQELLAYANPERKQTLYYWHRDKHGSKAEVDYVIQRREKLVPIEVKSGITGGLKSLLMYVKTMKGSDRGVHLSQRPHGERLSYISLPLYHIVKLFE